MKPYRAEWKPKEVSAWLHRIEQRKAKLLPRGRFRVGGKWKGEVETLLNKASKSMRNARAKPNNNLSEELLPGYAHNLPQSKTRSEGPWRILRPLPSRGHGPSRAARGVQRQVNTGTGGPRAIRVGREAVKDGVVESGAEDDGAESVSALLEKSLNRQSSCPDL